MREYVFPAGNVEIRHDFKILRVPPCTLWLIFSLFPLRTWLLCERLCFFVTIQPTVFSKWQVIDFAGVCGKDAAVERTGMYSPRPA